MGNYQEQQPQPKIDPPEMEIDQIQPPQSPFRRWIPAIVGVAIVGFAVGGIFAWQFFQGPEEARVPENETVVWKTYTNTFTNYQIKYPNNWQAVDEYGKGFYEEGYLVSFSDPSGEDKNSLAIFSGETTARGIEGWRKFEEENIEVADSDAKKYTFRPTLSSEQTAIRHDLPQTARKIIAEFGKGDIQYSLEFSIFNANLELADTVLSTFKFTGAGPTKMLEDLQDLRKEGRNLRRETDMRQIILAQELYYADNNMYLTSANWPSAIGFFMPETPTDTGDSAYIWIDNTEDNQKYCAYAALEGGGWFAASHNGGSECSDDVPTLNDCCF